MAVRNPIRITADEVNCLIYSYFRDAGLKHSAFTILHEGHIQNSPHLSRHIPRGELIDLLGKALMYIECQTHWRSDTAKDCVVPFSLLEQHSCSSEAIPLQPPIQTAPTAQSTPYSQSRSQPILSYSNSAPKPQPIAKTPTSLPNPLTSQFDSASSGGKPTLQRQPAGPSLTPATHPDAAGNKRKSSPVDIGNPNEKRQRTEQEDDRMAEDGDDHFEDDGPEQSLSAVKSAKKTKAKRPRPGPGDMKTDPRAIRLLPGHTSEVFVCAWNPVNHSQLATGSKDSEVIFWDLSKKPLGPNDYVTDHRMQLTLGKLSNDSQGDLTAINWSADGSLLAIGSYDSILRVATATGSIYMTSDLHEGPIFSAKFSQKGHMLLTASLDGTVSVWDVDRRELYRHFGQHKDCCLDVDWINDKMFASAGADRRINVMNIDQDEPLKVYEGHSDEINQIRVNSSGTRIASASDDGTGRIWRLDNLSSSTDSIPGLGSSEDDYIELRGHTGAISSICWCPSSQLWKGHEIVATASFDHSSKLWDAITGELITTFTVHGKPIYTLTFSPDGRFVATGGGDGWFHVHNVSTHALVWSYFVGDEMPGIFELDWQIVDGFNRIAIAMEARTVAVIDWSKVVLSDGSDPVTSG